MPQKAGPPYNPLLEIGYNPLNSSKSGREFFNKKAGHIPKGEAIWSLESLIKYVNNLPNKDDYPKTIEALQRDLEMLRDYSGSVPTARLAAEQHVWTSKRISANQVRSNFSGRSTKAIGERILARSKKTTRKYPKTYVQKKPLTTKPRGRPYGRRCQQRGGRHRYVGWYWKCYWWRRRRPINRR